MTCAEWSPQEWQEWLADIQHTLAVCRSSEDIRELWSGEQIRLKWLRENNSRLYAAVREDFHQINLQLKSEIYNER